MEISTTGYIMSKKIQEHVEEQTLQGVYFILILVLLQTPYRDPKINNFEVKKDSSRFTLFLRHC